MTEAFTYEDIYELLRNEKFSADLQPIKLSDLERIREYIKAKKALLKQQEEDLNILSTQKRAKIRLEIENAIRALKDLYETRERKVINRAIFTIRTGADIKDTTNMFAGEEKLYTALLTLLSNSRDEFLKLVEGEGEIPAELEAEAQPEPTHPETEKEQSEEELELEPETPKEEVKEEGPEMEGGSEEIRLVALEIIEDCPQCVGENLKTYGPFKPGDYCELPQALAEVLIKQGKAKRRGEQTKEQMQVEGLSEPSEKEVVEEPLKEKAMEEPKPELEQKEPEQISQPEEQTTPEPTQTSQKLPEPSKRKVELSEEEKKKIKEAQEILSRMASGGN